MTLSSMEYYIVTPVEAINLITNPSFELGTTGYTASNASLTRNVGYARRGGYGLGVLPSSNATSGVYYAISLTNGVHYYFSCDVQAPDGAVTSLWFGDNAGNLVSALGSFTGNGQWQRKSIDYVAAASATYRLYLTHVGAGYGAGFSTDGWQLEANRLTTYIDGDLVGFDYSRKEYQWTGLPHASTSWRSGLTRSGGVEVRLKDYAKVTAVSGLGLPPIINNVLPSVLGGSFYQNAVFDDRVVSLKLAFSGTTPGDIQALRNGLINALNPRLISNDQPMLLRVRGFDSSNIERSGTVDIVCQYKGGLEGSWKVPGFEECILQFVVFSPYFKIDGELNTVLTKSSALTDIAAVLQRSSTGSWANPTGGVIDGAILCSCIGPDGSIYVGGSFTGIAGVANTSYIAKWNGSAWSALGTGCSADVLALACSTDGTLYAGGVFPQAGGVANTARIAKWNGSVWSAMGTGANDYVRAIAVHADGTVYIGGAFTLAGGVANTVRIAKWNGSAWVAMGTGANDVVRTIVIARNNVYIGGAFTSVDSVTNTKRIAKWNGSAWSALGTGVDDDSVYALLYSKDGSLYAGGGFTAVGGLAGTAYIAKWNGVSWSALGSGLGNYCYCLAESVGGLIFVGGAFTTASGQSLPESIVIWNGSTWLPVDIDRVGALLPSPFSLMFDRFDNLFIGIGYSGVTYSAAVTGITNSINNPGSAPASFKIVFVGPGTVYRISNFTADRHMYFNLALAANETATLDLNAQNPTFVSSFRGDIMYTILPGSNFDLQLLPGNNSFGCFISDATGATGATMIYTVSIESFDAAKY